MAESECSVCFEGMTDPFTLSCNHTFCTTCVRKTFEFQRHNQVSESCPLCRTPIGNGGYVVTVYNVAPEIEDPAYASIRVDIDVPSSTLRVEKEVDMRFTACTIPYTNANIATKLQQIYGRDAEILFILVSEHTLHHLYYSYTTTSDIAAINAHAIVYTTRSRMTPRQLSGFINTLEQHPVDLVMSGRAEPISAATYLQWKHTFHRMLREGQ
jgi:hypothetical protein